MRKHLSFFFLFLLLSCANERNNKSTPVYASKDLAKDTLAYTYQSTNETSPYFIENGQEIDTGYYKIKYPIFENEQVNNAIQPYIFIDRESNPKDAAQAFLEAFNVFVEENTPENVHSAWYKEIQSSIILNTPLFFTLQTSLNEYTGGAHDNHYSLFTVFDTDRRVRLNLKDLFLAGKVDTIKRIAEKKFREQEKLADSTNLSKDFFFEGGIFALNDNFGLTKDELIIYYNEYEIKPYSEGVTVLRIPYAEVKDLLNERGNRYINSIKQ